MGRQIKTTSQDLAYIAGFLDGDGSIMVQIKKRSDTKKGWRIMFTICFYQDTRHEKPLSWIRKKLGIGYISRRNDGITEYRINGYKTVGKILRLLKPFTRFKKEQVKLGLKLISLLKKDLATLSKKEKIKIANLMCDIRDENYKSHQRKYTRKQIINFISR